jgi:hypothetical protein
MENVTYTKLSSLVDDTFTVEKVGEHKYKMWDNAQSKMLISDDPQKGYRKVYPVTTDKGVLDLGAGQLGNLLEAVSYAGSSEIVGKTFNVKSNGKTGMEIRYFLNPVKSAPKTSEFTADDIPPEWA